jgi:hypothetical protein
VTEQIDLGTLHLDDEDMEAITPPFRQSDQAGPSKTADMNKTILEYLKNIDLQFNSFEEKLDKAARMLEDMCKSFPKTPSYGPHSGVIHMTDW